MAATAVNSRAVVAMATTVVTVAMRVGTQVLPAMAATRRLLARMRRASVVTVVARVATARVAVVAIPLRVVWAATAATADSFEVRVAPVAMAATVCPAQARVDAVAMVVRAAIWPATAVLAVLVAKVA
jgi:hypothetical protein